MAAAFVLASISAVAAQGESCASWGKICLGRTGNDQSFCAPKVQDCLATGCFTEGKKYGNGRHCGLH